MIFIQISLILLILFVLGLPLSFYCLRARTPNPFLLVAPHCGLAVLVIIAANAYLLNVPVSRLFFPVVGLCAVNLAIILVYLFSRMRNLKKSFADLVSSISARGRDFIIPTLLFAATCFVYAFPFILNPDLVFYAYAGTDGYAYMSTAEYQISHGVYDAPRIDVYHVHSGLIKAFTNISANWVEKPGTMVVLAFFSSLLSRLPHEIFSPLMLTYVLLIFLSVFALAQRLGFGPILSGLAGFLSTVSPSVLALSSNTFFSATITVSLLPVILFLAQDILSNRKSALLFVVMYTAYFLFSPPSLIIPVAASFFCIAYSAFQHYRKSTKMVAVNGTFLFGVFLILNPLAYKLYVRNLGILNMVFASSPGVPRHPMDSVHQQLSWNLFWHTLGVGPIMASSGTKLEFFAWIVLGFIVLLAILFLACVILRRDFSILFFSYLSFWLVVLIGGVGGKFRSFEILSRVSQQFVPLHSLVYLSFVNKKDPIFWKSLLRRGPLIVALLIIMIYPSYPFLAFVKTSLFDNPQRINQYYQSSLRAREDVGRIVGQSPVLLNSSIPTFTGLFNVTVLFSNIRLAIPPAFFNLFFSYFGEEAPRPDNYFCAPTVLTSKLYIDIYDKDDEQILYQKNGFKLSKNDLILLFDNETFEIKNGFYVEFLKERSLVQARKLTRNTVVRVCSAEARTVRLIFRYTALANERAFDLNVSPSTAIERIVFGKEGGLTTPAFSLSKGVNRIELRSESAGEGIEILGISIKMER